MDLNDTPGSQTVVNTCPFEHRTIRWVASPAYPRRLPITTRPMSSTTTTAARMITETPPDP